MMQPPLSAAVLHLQPRSRVSWFIPKLWPSSCARVTAAPRGLSEWSSKKYKRPSSHLLLLICLLPWQSQLPAPLNPILSAW